MNLNVIKFSRPGSVRLIDEKGGQVGILSVKEALDIAQDRGYDLIEVSPSADPPVCRLMNYGKIMYQQAKREKQQPKGKVHKEIRMGPRIADGDLAVKVNKTKEFIERENEVTVSVILRGRERNTPELATEVLHRFLERLRSATAFKIIRDIDNDNESGRAEVIITNN